MNDEWGGIDKKIKKTVSYLNLLGIPTTGSCEGHVDHGSPAPWIKVTVPHEPPITKRNTAIYRAWQNKNKIVLRKVLNLLDGFYKNRVVSRGIRLVVKTAHSGFWIHNGGADYTRWRALIDKNVAGKQKRRRIDEKECVMRKQKLSIYQKEIELFEKFLKKRIRKS